MPLRRCWIRSLPFLLPLLVLLPALAASAANWRDLQQVGNTAYFLVTGSSAASVERVQMDGSAAGIRLPSLPLSTSPSGPLAFAVDAGSPVMIYVAYADRIDRVPTTGAPAQKLTDIATGAIALYDFGDFLFVIRTAPGTGITVEAVKKADGSKLALQTPSTRQASGFAFESQHGRVFAFASGSPGVLLLSFQLDSDGSVGSALEASIPTPLGSGRLFPFPDGTRVADAGGTVYSASDLLTLDSFTGAVSSLAFRGDVPIVLRGAQIVTFSNTLEQAALKTLPTSGDPPPPPLPSAILVQDDRIYAFSDDNDKDSNGHPLILQAQSFAFDGDLSGTPPSGQAIDPHTTAFNPNGVALDDQDGTLYLLDTADLRLFRWGAAAMDYLAAIELPDTPRFLAVSHLPGQAGTVYLGYSGGVVKQLPIGATTGLAPYVDVKAPLCGLVAADALVVTCQKGASAGTTTTATTATSVGAARTRRGPGGSSTSAFYTSFGSDTTRLVQVSGPPGSGFVWSSAAGRLYFLTSSGTTRGARGSQVAALPLNNDGSFGTLVSSSVSSRASRGQSGSLALPIVPTADGATLLLGSGQQLDAVSLALLPVSLPAPSGAGALVDAATPGGAVWTFRSVGGVAEADQVEGGSVTARALFEGTPLRLFALGDAELVALGSVGGVPTPSRWEIVPTGPLAGRVRFASTTTTPLFDLAALHYSDPGSNSELTFDTIDMSETGQVGAHGQLEFTSQTPVETVQADLSGSLTGSGGSTLAQLHFVYHDGTLNGQPFSGTTDMKLTAFDGATNALTGTQTLNLTIGRQRLSKSAAASWVLPTGVDGSWTLDVTLSPPSGGAITGSAELQVHPEAPDSVAPGRSISVPLSGTVDAATGHATLSGSNGDASVSLDDVTPLARGVEGTVGVHWLGQDRSADLNGAPAD